MRFKLFFATVLFAFAFNIQRGFASTSATDGLSITPQDGHILFDDSIDHAQISIDMIMYHLTDSEVVTHLMKAQQRGVQVRIILDSKAISGGGSKVIFDQLNSSGIQVRPSSSAFSISHAKSAVFDNQWALITSMNLTQTFTFSRDYGIRTYDPNVVSEFESVFAADWQNSQDNSKMTPVLNCQKLAWSPVNSKSKILALLNSAQSSIALEVENLGDTDILNTLKSKSQSGVKVVVMTPACVEGSGTRNFQFLTDLSAAGVDARVAVPPYNAKNPYLHGKSIVVDQQSYYVGSENFSTNSLNFAREVGIIDSNNQISSTILMAMAYDANQAVPIAQVDSNFNCASYENTKNVISTEEASATDSQSF